MPGGRTFMTEGGARAKTLKQKYFLVCLRRIRRQFSWSRVSKGAVVDEIARRGMGGDHTAKKG